MEELSPQLKMVLEHLDQKLDIIVEGRTADREKLDAVSEKLDATSEKLGAVSEKLNATSEKLDAVSDKLDATFEAVGELKVDMVEVKGQLDLVRKELKSKVDRDEFHLLEQRVSRLERTAARA